MLEPQAPLTFVSPFITTQNAIVYKYEINDREIGSNLEQTVGLMKHITMSQLSAGIAQSGPLGKHNREFLKALVNCGQWMKIEYYEKNTGARASFEISVSEINDILSGKYQKNALTIEDWNSLGNALEELECDSVYVEDAYADSAAYDYEEDYSCVE